MKSLTSDAARILGRVTSEKKAAASKRNGFQPRPLASFACKCDGPHVTGKTTCPRGKVEWTRRRIADLRREKRTS